MWGALWPKPPCGLPRAPFPWQVREKPGTITRTEGRAGEGGLVLGRRQGIQAPCPGWASRDLGW